jgi:hypothetical protein
LDGARDVPEAAGKIKRLYATLAIVTICPVGKSVFSAMVDHAGSSGPSGATGLRSVRTASDLFGSAQKLDAIASFSRKTLCSPSVLRCANEMLNRRVFQAIFRGSNIAAD